MTGQAPGGGPLTVGPPTEMAPPGAPYSAVPPFVPPVIPPMGPNHTGGKHSPSQHSSYNLPHGPGSQSPNLGYQQLYGPVNQFQQPLGDYNVYQNHTGPGTFSDANSTSGPYSSPNHTGFNGGSHTNWGPVNPSTPSTGLSPAPGPGQQPPPPFFTLPSPPTGPQQPGRQERKHHHHEWLAPDSACEHPDCPLVAPTHQCSPNRETCNCVCCDPNCLVTKRGL